MGSDNTLDLDLGVETPPSSRSTTEATQGKPKWRTPILFEISIAGNTMSIGAGPNDASTLPQNPN